MQPVYPLRHEAHERTYPSALIAPDANDTSHLADIDEIATNAQQPLSPSSLRRRREQHVLVNALMNSSHTESYHLLNSSSKLPQCLQCHTTCLKCTGPKATDCSECQAAFRFQPIASGGESSICVSINDKRQPQLDASNNDSSGQLKTSEFAVQSNMPIATGSDASHHNYLPSVFFLGGVLVVAFAAIYVLWLHCFQGTPGIGDLTSASALVGDSGDGASGAGLASIRYDRVHTNEQEEDDESGSSDDDEGDLLSVSATQIIAPIVR
uniref:Uncharacterized protein n=1 Tax=Anopheles culicifacies TaxID=139723 RepID=A0A182M9L1_9DIPT